jgi:hypothetical protein
VVVFPFAFHKKNTYATSNTITQFQHTQCIFWTIDTNTAHKHPPWN